MASLRRMKSVGCALVALAAIVLSGCASVAVERAKDLSSAGIQYAQATAKVIDVAMRYDCDIDD